MDAQGDMAGEGRTHHGTFCAQRPIVWLYVGFFRCRLRRGTERRALAKDLFLQLREMAAASVYTDELLVHHRLPLSAFRSAKSPSLLVTTEAGRTFWQNPFGDGNYEPLVDGIEGDKSMVCRASIMQRTKLNQLPSCVISVLDPLRARHSVQKGKLSRLTHTRAS